MGEIISYINQGKLETDERTIKQNYEMYTR